MAQYFPPNFLENALIVSKTLACFYLQIKRTFPDRLHILILIIPFLREKN